LVAVSAGYAGVLHQDPQIQPRINPAEFFADDMVVDAVLRNLEVLGEAAKQIPPAVRERHPQVPWRRISGLRDVLVHAYFGLEEDTIWQIVSESIPALAQQLEQVVKAEP
jgi:uncharacterized protein with HEPN domain